MVNFDFNFKPESGVEGLVGRGEDCGTLFGVFDGLLEAAAVLANVSGELAESTSLLFLEMMTIFAFLQHIQTFHFELHDKE